MRVAGIAFMGLLIVLAWNQSAYSQKEIAAEIQRTNTPPEIDGIGNDVVWQRATEHGRDEFFTVFSEGEEPDDEFDLDVTWKALWDDDNLYVLIEVADDELINDVACNHNDDSIEVYIDAQNLDLDDYNPGTNPGFPAYQFRSIAGSNMDAVCAPLIENTAFNGGINSYEGDDLDTHYPQGADTSVNVTSDDAELDPLLAYSFEVAFPWEALEETPANILANGEFGFGVQANDSDFNAGNRETMFLWAHDQNDMWQRADAFPSVALSNETVDGGGEIKPKLQAGDADQDLDFDQLDLVKVQIAAKYLTGAAATWGEGDWNGAPGGEQGSPPAGNGFFDQLDIIAALGPGHYLTGPYAALAEDVDVGLDDEQTSLVYDTGTGELAVNAPASTNLTSINIESAASMFIGDKPAVLDGAFDNFAPDNIFKATFGGSFGDISFGNVLPTGLSAEEVRADLSAVGSLEGGGDLGAVDLVYIPEPSSLVLLTFSAIGILFLRRRRLP